MKKLAFLFYLVPVIAFSQQTVGLFFNDNTSYNGYTLFNQINDNQTYLIDNCGDQQYIWNSSYPPGASIYLLDDGNLLRTAKIPNSNMAGPGIGGRIEILDPQSNVIWEYTCSSDSITQHHDIEMLPNGNILIIAWEFISAAETILKGSSVPFDRYSEVILEVDTTTNQIVWEWHAWDHLVQDQDSTKANYGVISKTPNKINVNYGIGDLDSDIEWLHINSIDYNENLDQIVLSTPYFDELWIIDHSTTSAQAQGNTGGNSGKGGQLLYRWGNPQTYERGSSSDKILDFQHDVQWIADSLVDGGKIMIFNNGQQRGYSSIEIISPPIDSANGFSYFISDSTFFGPNLPSWSYFDSTNFYAPYVSGVQRLENGNTLICSGVIGEFFEIEYLTDSIVWRYKNPISTGSPISQGSINTNPLCFRIHRHSPDELAISNLVLTNNGPIELNPINSNCQINNCSNSVPSALVVNWTTDTKASVSWDNMNDSACMVFKYFIRYRVDNLDGTYGSWVTKSAGVGNGLCNFGLNTTEKRLQFLTAATTYQFKMKAFYCGGTQSGYSTPESFTTGADCPPMTNLGVQTFNGNQAKATFSWDTTGAYVFARVALRVDTAGAAWGTAGGFGIYYPTLSVNKFGLTPGQSYRAQGRTFCDSNVTSYRSTWTTPVLWTQPGTLIRMESTSQIKNLDVYPNPSRDIFNIRFVSEKIQDLSIRVVNIIGEVVYKENASQFIGEYTKKIDLVNNSKGIYFIEIVTTDGIINKKIILN